MNDQDRIRIASNFVDSHKSDDPQDWLISSDYKFCTGDEKLLQIYNAMCFGVWGESDCEYDYGMFSLEIKQRDSKSGHTENFDWEDEEAYRKVRMMDVEG